MNAMHIRKIDLNLLVTFEAVYRHGNATLAARELGLTQPAVSHAIRRLRNVYGDPLFIRSKGGMQPTIKADQIAPSVQNALKGINLTLETPRLGLQTTASGIAGCSVPGVRGIR